MPRSIHTFIAALALTSVACVQTEDAALDPVSSAENDVVLQPANVDRTLLHSVVLSETHVVHFWEFEPGVILVEEQSHADTDSEGQLANAAKQDATLTLGDIYRRVAPEGSPLPEALRLAEQRIAEYEDMQAELRASAQGRDIDADPPPSQPENPFTAGDGTTVMLRPDWDWNADADWFLANFCSDYNYTYRWCPTNVGYAYSGAKYDTSGFKSSGFAAGFNASPHFTGKYRSCSGWGPWYSCSWKLAWDEWVSPRYIRTYWWSTSGSRWAGIDSTDLVGLAVLWNNQTSTPSCGGYNQFCCGGSSCNAGLACEGGGCYNPGPCNDVGESCCSYQYVADWYCNNGYVCSGTCKLP
jgi:hypothetical protein